MTAQGHPRSTFQRAIERGNLLVAETILRSEIPRPSISDLLELTALIALKDARRRQRVTVRWLVRYLEVLDQPTIEDAAVAVAALNALGGRYHDPALMTLRAIVERANQPPSENVA